MILGVLNTVAQNGGAPTNNGEARLYRAVRGVALPDRSVSYKAILRDQGDAVAMIGNKVIVVALGTVTK